MKKKYLLLRYERMTATKERFGKTGGNVAYHGYQSFQTGEVTPEEAHKIGMETARRMWGENYEIVVTTHLNTDTHFNPKGRQCLLEQFKELILSEHLI